MTLAISGIGAEFQLGDGASPEVFTKVAEATSMTPPSPTVSTIDVSSMDSTGGYQEFIDGFRDGGEASVEFNWVSSNAGQVTLRDRALSYDSVTRNYRIVLNDSPQTTFTFGARVSGCEFSISPTEAVKATVTLKVSGEPTLTP